MIDMIELQGTIEDIVDDLSLISNTLNKVMFSINPIVNEIENIRIDEDSTKRLTEAMIKYALSIIDEITNKLDKIKKNIEDIAKKIETME